MSESFIFVSHATEDLVMLLPLINATEKRGERLWLASRNISPGAIWSVALNEAIHSCRCVLLVLSKRSNSSSYVANEISVAHTLNKPIVVLRLDDVEPSPSLVMLIAMIQRLDAFGSSPAMTAERLVRAVDSAVQRAQLPSLAPTRELPRRAPAPAPLWPRIHALLEPKKVALACLPALLIIALTWHHLAEEQEPLSSVHAMAPATLPDLADSPPAASEGAREEVATLEGIPPDNTTLTPVSPTPQVPRSSPPPAPQPSLAILKIKALYFGVIIGDHAFIRAKPTVFADYFATSNLTPKSSLIDYFTSKTSDLYSNLDRATLSPYGQTGHPFSDPYLEEGGWCLVWSFEMPPSARELPPSLAHLKAALLSLATRALSVVTHSQ